jgi:putative aldouronate transport system permease protein
VVRRGGILLIRKSATAKTFDILNYAVLTLVGLVTVLPFLYIILVSLTPAAELTRREFLFIPHSLSLQAYRYIFSTPVVYSSLLVSVFVTVTGTAINIFMACLMAYPLAHHGLMGRKTVMLMVTFTLLFDGGMIPTFMVIQKLGMLNRFSSVLLPSAMSAFSLIIFINFFRQLPPELEQSARIDGCHELRILAEIIMPLSMPLIATFIVIFGVDHWNRWFSYVLYINDSAKWPVQVVLRQILSTSDASIGDRSILHDMDYVPPNQTIRMCITATATIPILCVYPFLQRHFVRGMLLGSVKG